MVDRILTPEEAAEQTEQFFRESGLALMVPDWQRWAAVAAAFGLAFQDLILGESKDCQCGPCVRLRSVSGTFEGMLDGIFGG